MKNDSQKTYEIKGLNPMLLSDFYKLSHRVQYPQGTEKIYSTWTCRTSRLEGVDKTLFFGLQKFIKEYLIDYFNNNFFNVKKEVIIEDYKRLIKNTLGDETPFTKHIEDLHDLGYLPIKIKAIDEGSLVPIRVPCLTIENTNPQFFWITNFLETLMSCELWQSITSATISSEYRKIVEKYANETCDNKDHIYFQCHDFSMRGMSSVSSAINSGIGHLLSFKGTDTIPAIIGMEKYYNANVENELVGSSISATEHSVMCSYGKTNELDLFRHLIKDVYPNGIFSVVSDTWDLWKVLGEYIPKLKDDILARNGKMVLRPDSGNPVDIICGNIDIISLCEKDLKYINSLDDLLDYFEDDARDYFRETEDDNVKYYVRYDGKVYELSYNAEYMSERGGYSDNKYYVLDSIDSYIEEYELTMEDKGVLEILWDIFGGTLNSKGYKVLDPHIGSIYGDSITLERAREICQRLKDKGFASSNIVLGVGSYSFQMNTRDTFGQAMKATYAVVNNEERLLFKDPITDDGTKRSQRGQVAVIKSENEDIKFVDGLYKKDYENDYKDIDLLTLVFEDGKLIKDDSLQIIRGRVESQI